VRCLSLCWFARKLWRPRFLINPNNRSTQPTVVKSRSTWALTPKNSLTYSSEPFWLVNTLMGPTMVKDLIKPLVTLVSIDVCRNFCRVLQNSPKHLKFYLYESCPSCWVTQLSCRLAFQILSGKAWKIGSKGRIYCSVKLVDIQSWHLNFSLDLNPNHIRP
jgi:hypothetical protein